MMDEYNNREKSALYFLVFSTFGVSFLNYSTTENLSLDPTLISFNDQLSNRADSLLTS
jgi:hypothetical protein